MHAPVSLLRAAPAVACAVTLFLTACGGGGGGASDGAEASEAGAPSAAAPAGDAAFSTLVGNYTVACSGKTTADGTQSSEGTLVVTGPDETGRTQAQVHLLRYASAAGDARGAQCDPATLSFDATVSGTLRDLGSTKSVLGADGKRYPVKLVEFTFSGLRLSKGSWTGSLPGPDVTVRLGYRLSGGQLQTTFGPREADGVPARLHARSAVKQ